MGYPDFLFEWTIVLFMVGKMRDAEKKLFETFCGNTYIINKFLGNEIIQIEKWEGSNLANPEFTDYFQYSVREEKLCEFSKWLAAFVKSEKFLSATEKYIDTEKRLLVENDYEIRHYLIEHQKQLLKEF